MIPMVALTIVMEITRLGWLGAGLPPVMMISCGLIGVLAWREGRRYGRAGTPDSRR